MTPEICLSLHWKSIPPTLQEDEWKSYGMCLEQLKDSKWWQNLNIWVTNLLNYYEFQYVFCWLVLVWYDPASRISSPVAPMKKLNHLQWWPAYFRQDVVIWFFEIQLSGLVEDGVWYNKAHVVLFRRMLERVKTEAGSSRQEALRLQQEKQQIQEELDISRDTISALQIKVRATSHSSCTDSEL